MINVSSISGLDFKEDGRGLAVTDWDHDGDVDLWVTNRTAPGVRVLRNQAAKTQHFLSLQLVGTRCNRDAIGARVVLLGRSPISTQSLRAGDAFISQSSKTLHFGLGGNATLSGIEVRWPDGTTETIEGLKADRHYQFTQGAGSAVLIDRPSHAQLVAKPSQAAPVSGSARIVAYSRLPLPKAELTSFLGQTVTVGGHQLGKPPLVNLWGSWCSPCIRELEEMTRRHAELVDQGVEIRAVSVDLLGQEHRSEDQARAVAKKLALPFPVLWATEGFIDGLEATQRVLMDEQTPLPLPSSFLLDAQGRVAVVYRGPVTVEQLLADLDLLKVASDQLGDIATPFTGKRRAWPMPVDPIQIALKLFEGEDAALVRRYTGQLIELAETKGPGHETMNVAELHYFMGTLLEDAKQDQRSVSAYQFAIKRDPKHVQAHHNLARVLTRLGKHSVAATYYQKALSLNPNDLELFFETATALYGLSQVERAVTMLQTHVQRHPKDLRGLRLLSWIYATAKDPAHRNAAEALELAQSAISVSSPNDPVSADVLAAALAETGAFDKALTVLDTAIKSAGDSARLEAMKRHRAAYAVKQPWRE